MIIFSPSFSLSLFLFDESLLRSREARERGKKPSLNDARSRVVDIRLSGLDVFVRSRAVHVHVYVHVRISLRAYVPTYVLRSCARVSGRRPQRSQLSERRAQPVGQLFNELRFSLHREGRRGEEGGGEAGGEEEEGEGKPRETP